MLIFQLNQPSYLPFFPASVPRKALKTLKTIFEQNPSATLEQSVFKLFPLILSAVELVKRLETQLLVMKKRLFTQAEPICFQFSQATYSVQLAGFRSYLAAETFY